ncbi:uncharacterized protein LOC109801863 [Cajanus cajan]|nr:uncharacterized protein LOC109801863 [Cajanus cajan]
MHKHKARRGTESFVVIQIRGSSTEEEEKELEEQGIEQKQIPQPHPKLNLSAMKLFQRFRKILMRFVFSVPSRRSSDSRHKVSDRFEPPKTSCSSYYSSYSHYNEAIADCIEFFNKSAQDGVLDGRKSDVV